MYGILARTPGHRLKQSQICELLKQWRNSAYPSLETKTTEEAEQTFRSTVRHTLTTSTEFYCLNGEKNGSHREGGDDKTGGAYWTICMPKLIEVNVKKQAMNSCKKLRDDLAKHDRHPNHKELARIKEIQKKNEGSDPEAILVRLQSELEKATAVYEEALENAEDDIKFVTEYQGSIPPSALGNASASGSNSSEAGPSTQAPRKRKASSTKPTPSNRAKRPKGRTPLPDAKSVV